MNFGSLVVWWLKIISFLLYFLRMRTVHWSLLMIWGYFLTKTLCFNFYNKASKSSKGYIVPPATIVNRLFFIIFSSYSLYRHKIFIAPFFISPHFNNRICFSVLSNANYSKNARILLILLTDILLSSPFLSFSLLLSWGLSLELK